MAWSSNLTPRCAFLTTRRHTFVTGLAATGVRAKSHRRALRQLNPRARTPCSELPCVAWAKQGAHAWLRRVVVDLLVAGWHLQFERRGVDFGIDDQLANGLELAGILAVGGLEHIEA